MSGLEIAGLVLGGLPLLISAAEHYREGFEPLVKWKRFRRDFIGFIDSIDIEKQLYDQMLERFLISSNIPNEELQSFLTIANYRGWQDHQLALKARLGPSYAVYMSILKTMNNLMGDLQGILSMKDGEVRWSKEGASKWDYQLKRIYLSFSGRGAITVAALETQNRKLRELLDSNDRLDSMKATQRNTSWASIFECIRRHASSLHGALANGWHCDCVSPHFASLQLQRRSLGGWSSRFNIAFDVPASTPQAGIAVASRREVIIISDQQAVESESGLFASPKQGLNLDRIRADFESPEQKVSIPPSTPGRLSPSSVTPTSSRIGFRDFFSKSNSTSNASTITNSNGTEIELEDSQSSWLSRRKTKPKKSVSMILPETSTAVTQPIPIPQTIQETETSTKIENLCSILSASDWNSPCLGYLSDDEQRRHELRPGKGSPLSTTPISLASLLSNERGQRLSRRDRHKLAGILASSLLQLQCTPWLANKMKKESIFFHHQDEKVHIDRPYVSQSFTSTKTCPLAEGSQSCQPSIEARFATRNSLHNLGILLLELCFGEPIEKQGLWANYLGPDGRPNDGTAYMTARDWVELVSDEEPALEHIIRCCVLCSFEEKADWNNKKFTQAVYTAVVEPLEKIIREWSNE